jgi:lysophospholipase L1-like esterase
LEGFLIVSVSTALAFGAGELLVRARFPQLGWGNEVDPSLGWSSEEYQSLDPEGESRHGEGRLLFLGDSFLAGGGVARRAERLPEVLARRLGDRREVRVLASGGWGPDQELLAFLQKGRPWGAETVVLCFCATNDLANIVSNGRGYGTSKPYFVLEGDDLRLYDESGAPRELDVPPHRPSYHFRSHLWRFVRHKAREMLAKESRALEGTLPEAPPDGVPPEARHDREEASVDPRYLLFPAFQANLDQTRAWLREVEELEPRLSWSPQRGMNHVRAFLTEDDELSRYAWDLLGAILARLDAEVRASGGRFLVMLLPVPLKAGDLRFVTGSDFEFSFETPDGVVHFRSAEPRDRLRVLCERFGIELFDPTAKFLELVSARDLLKAAWPDPDDIHFSGVGHALLAEIFQEYLSVTEARRGATGVRPRRGSGRRKAAVPREGRPSKIRRNEGVE